MSSSPLEHFFDRYHVSGSDSLARLLYFKYIQSPLTVKLHFGMKVLPIDINKRPRIFYFNITTILLQEVLRQKMRSSSDLKLLEIGVGSFAVLCGYLSRFTTQTIDATDIDRNCLENAEKHIELNKVNVNVFYSDIFSDIPPGKYDIISWNPLYDIAEPNSYLPNLFKSTPDFMNDKGQLIIAYGTRALPRKTVLNILANYKQLRLAEIKTWWWNPHEVMVIEKN